MTISSEARLSCATYGAVEVQQLLDLDSAIATQREAFSALANRAVSMPPKVFAPDGSDDATVFSYLARLGEHSGSVLKFGSVHPANAAIGLPTITALITLLDPVTGRPVAIMDGAAITALRTSAASAVAFDILGRADATRLAVIGSGVQAINHVRAAHRVRPLSSVRMWAPNPGRLNAAAAGLRDELGLDVVAAGSAQDAVLEADLIALCTLSTTPILSGDWLKPGATVISIGSFEPHRHEIDQNTVDLATHVVVDHVETALEHAGPIMKAVAHGRLDPHRMTELGDHINTGEFTERAPEDIVYYNSTGVAVQDAAAAWAIHRRGIELAVGGTVIF